MRYRSVEKHLQPYVILSRRRTTINHAFASAIAPFDKFDDGRIREAVETLGQDPDADLRCAYCDKHAETWDHVFATVRDSRFSGHGHRLGNLLPCCKACNSAKGNKDWQTYVATLSCDAEDVRRRTAAVGAYLSKYGVVDTLPLGSPELVRLYEIREEVLLLLAEADRLAALIRPEAG